MLRSEGWYFTDVSGQYIGLIFKDQAVQQERMNMFLLGLVDP
jgi:hypothetical protein